jgi:tetratricopeptide (TPR) repeat protein
VTKSARTLVALVALSAACRDASHQKVGAPPSPGLVHPAAAADPATLHFPATAAELPATDATIAVGNFEGLYRASLESARTQANRPPIMLAGLAATRALYFGRLDDYDRALSAAERVVKLAPRDPEAYLSRAGARQSLHDFAGASADLARAAELGGDRDTIENLRATILQATGKLDEALAIRTRAVAKRATFSSLAALAMVTAERGDTAGAEELFKRAQAAYDDVSPFAIAWLDFQAGLVEERAGRPSMARTLYAAAVARLPQYAPAVGHLAALEAARDPERARDLLEPIVAQSDDPEYEAALAPLVDGPRGQSLVASAQRRYEESLRLHPAAFADHAARFYLSRDPKRALALAERNLAARPTQDAYALAVEAALAAGQDARACALADAALTTPHAGAALAVRAAQAFTRCDRADAAGALLASLSRR